MDRNEKFAWKSGDIKVIKKGSKFGVPKLKELLDVKELHSVRTELNNTHPGKSCGQVHFGMSHKKWEKSKEKA